jgi:hypothetical protein
MNRKEYKDIGEVYRDRFKDHESELNEASWSKIKEKLPANENYFTAFWNTMVNPRFIGGIITGVLITSGIFFLTSPKEGKEYHQEIALNSKESSSNNNVNAGNHFSSERKLSSDKNDSEKASIPDTENKIYPNHKESLSIKSGIETENSEGYGSLSIQKETFPDNESDAITERNSRRKNNTGDLKKSGHSSKIISGDSPFNRFNKNSHAKNNDIAMVEENKRAVARKNQNQNNNSNTLPDNISSSLNPISEHLSSSDPLLASGHKNSEPVNDKNQSASLQNNSIQVKPDNPSVKTNESNLSTNDSILNKSIDILTSEAQKINPPSLGNNSGFESISSEKEQLTIAGNKDNDKAAIADSNSVTKMESESKEKKPVQDHKSTSKLNSSPQSKWVLGYYFSPESSFRKLSANSNFKKQEGDRNNNEKAKIGFSTGITLGYKISNKIILSSGLYMLNVGEKGACPSKDSTSIVNYTNNYTYLGIPLLLGYKIGSSKFGTTINSGLIVTALVSAQNKGDIYYDDDYYTSGTKKDDDNEESPFKIFNLVYIGNVEFNYQLYKKLSLHAGPSIKYFLTSIYKEDHPIKSKPYSLGFQAGVKYHF